MDHLVSLLGPTERGALFQIPYVAQEYDQGNFIAYGGRRGFGHVGDLLQLHEEDERSFTALLQTWLYFGLLWEVFGPSCRSQDFIKPCPTGSFISTTRLDRYCEEWLSGTSDRSEFGRILDSLDFATSLSDRLDEELQGTRLSEASLVIFSIKILVDTLAVVVKIAVRRSGDPKAVIRKPAVSQFLVHYLLDSGWCRARLAKSGFWLHSDSLYLLTAFEPSVLIGENHQSCSRESCRVDNLSDYSPQHTASCARNECPLVHAPLEKLVSICRKGQVPVLSCDVSSTGVSDIDVIPSSQCPSFIAVSHVWSDGLGNDKANALYQCQLTDVAGQVCHRQAFLDDEFAESERPDMPAVSDRRAVFWLDTMCIPLDLQARKAAIGQIDWIFAAAGAVLVRDSTLRDLSLPYDMPPLHLAIRMHWMKWLTRCWTLAEGAAAWRIYLQFRGAAYSLDRLLEHLSNNELLSSDVRTPPEYNNIVLSAIQSDLLRIFEVLNFAKQGESYFSRTWNSVLLRSTTKIQDLPGILSIANAVSIREVVQLPQEQRLEAVINTFKEIPAALLFNTGRKCEGEPKNRWVPSQVHGANLITQEPTLTTYLEGRMLGPLHPGDFHMFTFRGTDLSSFDLRTETSQTSLQFHVEMLDSLGRQLPEQEWCLVLPKDFVDKGFLATSSCKAFCATVQKKSLESVGLASQRPSLLVRWETLAQVTVCPKPTTSSAIVFYNPHLGDLYIECDMATWPSPTALSSFLTREQTQQMNKKLFNVGSVGATYVVVGGVCGTVIGTAEHLTGIRVTLGVTVTMVVLYTAWIGFLTHKGVNVARFEADVRTQENWKRLFIDLNSRAQLPLRFRLLHWLRHQYNPHSFRASRDKHIELGSQDSTGCASALVSWVRVARKLTKTPLNDFLLACSMLLCVAEFGILLHIDCVSWGHNIRFATGFVTCLVGLLLICIPLQWVWYNVRWKGRPNSLIIALVRTVQLFFWLVCMSILIFVSRSATMEFHRPIGNVAATLAGLQPLIIFAQFVHEQLLWLATQWRKSRLTYYDVFEDPGHLRIELPENIVCSFFVSFVAPIWNPLRLAFERSKSRYR